MNLKFTKMNGAGNDFIVVDNRARKIKLSRKQVIELCHRQRGIGADGLMLLVKAKSPKADWAWDFYNSDGSTAAMCGNGARCFAQYVKKLTKSRKSIVFETGAGLIAASFTGDLVTVNLTAPQDLKLEQKVKLQQGEENIHSVNTGVPHAVVFVNDADAAMVQERGREIRYHADFAPRGINVNFVQRMKPGHIRVRTYERGVEGETLACGTGVSASALITARLHQFKSPVKVQVQGGDMLQVAFNQDAQGNFSNVRLTGPADFVFSGTIEI